MTLAKNWRGPFNVLPSLPRPIRVKGKEKFGQRKLSTVKFRDYKKRDTFKTFWQVILE